MNPRAVAAALAGVVAGVGSVLAWPAAAGYAHPLGSFTVNQYQGLTLHPDRIDVTSVVDTAEIPTAQDRAVVDTDHDGTVSDPERAAHAATACRDLAGAFTVTVRNDRLRWTVTAAEYLLGPVGDGTQTARMTCALTAPARLSAPATVRIVNRYRVDRIGWRELCASGAGVDLPGSPLPERSISDELRAYPSDPLASTPDVREAELRATPASDIPASDTAASDAPASDAPAANGPAASATGFVPTGWLAPVDRFVQRTVGAEHLSPAVAALAVLLALLLGAGHATLPGHGKAVLATYLAGRRGRPRDALTVAGAVVVTHTGGVLVLGVLLSVSAALVGERVLAGLGIASGVLVTAVGIGMLAGARRRRHHQHHDHGHHHDHGGHHHHGHRHGPGRRSRAGDHRTGRLSLAGIGVAGGLVPSPSALVVLLGAIGIGRTALGIVLVLAYGLGMAGTLAAAGLLLVAAQRRIAWSRLTARLATAGPVARLATAGPVARLAARLGRARPLWSTVSTSGTAAMVVLLGVGIGLRATIML